MATTGVWGVGVANLTISFAIAHGILVRIKSTERCGYSWSI
jgi:hypothetical protein